MALVLCVQHVLYKHAGLKATFAAKYVASDLVGYSKRTVKVGRVVFMLQEALFWTVRKVITHEEYCGRMRISVRRQETTSVLRAKSRGNLT